MHPKLLVPHKSSGKYRGLSYSTKNHHSIPIPLLVEPVCMALKDCDTIDYIQRGEYGSNGRGTIFFLLVLPPSIVAIIIDICPVILIRCESSTYE